MSQEDEHANRMKQIRLQAKAIIEGDEPFLMICGKAVIRAFEPEETMGIYSLLCLTSAAIANDVRWETVEAIKAVRES